MPLDLPVLAPAELRDVPTAWPVVRHRRTDQWHVFALDSDVVTSPSGQEMYRTYLAHPGAVAVIALDDDDHVVLVRQYRHPVRQTMIEPPAGLRDEPGESTLATGARELAEEAHLQASSWRTLIDYQPSAGASSEGIRVLLARGLSEAPAPAGFEAQWEEAHMELVKAPVEAVVEAALAGQIVCSTLVMGVLALDAARRRGSLDALRAADEPWFQSELIPATVGAGRPSGDGDR